MNESTKLWIALVFGLAAAIVVVWTAPKQVHQPKGIILPAEKIKPAISPDQVSFFQVAPFDYQSMGLIRISRYMGNKPSVAAEKEMLTEAKKLAAQVGANGVVVKQFFHTQPGTSPEGLNSYYFMGEAIYVKGGNGIYEL
jgi:hypothetical protein